GRRFSPMQVMKSCTVCMQRSLSRMPGGIKPVYEGFYRVDGLIRERQIRTADNALTSSPVFHTLSSKWEYSK
ncbi:MAG: hypothetical protein PHI99_07785, partial [Syntrophales bacterium]|nr:hypothetical protein [Syntrophales bacterium]